MWRGKGLGVYNNIQGAAKAGGLNRFVLQTDFRTHTHLNNRQKLKTNSPSFSFIHWLALCWKRFFVCLEALGKGCDAGIATPLISSGATARGNDFRTAIIIIIICCLEGN